ncbi:MAG: nitronate monooxygenase [Gemmataceae bacterium]|nr:nitronate monooxygenase [Gemmataceae bacterium]
MWDTRFTRLVGCSVPLQQAGMGGVTTVELAAAVSNAGGLGMIATVRVPPAFLASMLDDVGSRTRGPFGVNFLMPFLNRDSLDIAASKARVVEFFYGDPDAKLVQIVHQAGALACWQVGSVTEARQAVDAGCDFVIAQGTEAGGHVRGRIGLLALLDQVLDAVKVPVVAAGGIGSARAMAAALAAGADGVRIGTRFVASAESAAHAMYKQALIGAEAADTVLTKAYSVFWPHAPHRVLRSCVQEAEALTGEEAGESVLAGVAWKIPRFATPAPTTAATGKIEAMAMYAGESVSQVRCVQPAAEIVRELADGAAQLLQQGAMRSRV